MGLKSLFKDTAIYGLSSIIGRFLNYLLVPIYTYTLTSTAEYGIISDVYAWTGIILVILTFGMETTFFRFMSRYDGDEGVFSTALSLVTGVSGLFCFLGLLFLPFVAGAMDYGNHPWYIGMMIIVVTMDAIQALFFSLLRYQKRAWRFAALKLLFIVINILLNLGAYVVMPRISDNWPIHAGYTFVINLICTSIVMLCFLPEFRKHFRFKAIRKTMAGQMLHYTWPLLILGIAGNLSQMAGQVLLPRLLPVEEGRAALGIYGACLKIAMIMALITQAFRYAYEPFVFAGSKDKDSPEMLARVMKIFIAFTLLAFLAVVAYLDILKYFIGDPYREGLRIVPIYMVAEILMGVYFNLSFWYKLCDRTIFGTYFSVAGCAVLLLVNILGIPAFGYEACAWAGVAGYGVCVILSYFFGQHYYPIPYPLKSIGVYVLMAAAFFYGMHLTKSFFDPGLLKMGLNTIFVLAFAAHILYHEFYKLRKA